MTKANREGIELTNEEAHKWIATINNIFPSIQTTIQQIGNQTRAENKITTISGTKIGLEDLPQQNTAIWNAVTRTSSNELVNFVDTLFY